jgi:MFS family permease
LNIKTISSPPISYLQLFVRGRRALSFSILLSVLLAALDVLIVNTVLPSVLRELGGIAWYAWAVGIYSLACFVTIPIFSCLVGKIGAQFSLSMAVALFLTGALVAALAPSMPWTVTGRALQGLGAGGFFAIPFVLISQHYPAEIQPRAVGLVSAVWGAAAVGGPFLGAGILQLLNWRWVFWFNFPLGALVMGFGILALKGEPRAQDEKATLNLAGPLLFALSTAAGLSAFSSSWPFNLLLALLAVAIFMLFFRHEDKHPNPIIPADAWNLSKPIGAAFLGMAIVTSSFGGTETYLPLLLQGLWGRSPLQAGWILSIGSITWSATSVLTPLFAERPRRLARQGAFLMASGVAIIFFSLWKEWPVWSLYAGWALAGCGIGATVPIFNNLALDVSKNYPHGIATGAVQLALTWGFAAGPAAAGAAAKMGVAELRTGGIFAVALCFFLALVSLLMVGKIPTKREYGESKKQ